jgi:hypothetical protein
MMVDVVTNRYNSELKTLGRVYFKNSGQLPQAPPLAQN